MAHMTTRVVGTPALLGRVPSSAYAAQYSSTFCHMRHPALLHTISMEWLTDTLRTFRNKNLHSNRWLEHGKMCHSMLAAAAAACIGIAGQPTHNAGCLRKHGRLRHVAFTSSAVEL